jgi:hypothetical protein
MGAYLIISFYCLIFLIFLKKTLASIWPNSEIYEKIYLLLLTSFVLRVFVAIYYGYTGSATFVGPDYLDYFEAAAGRTPADLSSIYAGTIFYELFLAAAFVFLDFDSIVCNILSVLVYMNGVRMYVVYTRTHLKLHNIRGSFHPKELIDIVLLSFIPHLVMLGSVSMPESLMFNALVGIFLSVERLKLKPSLMSLTMLAIYSGLLILSHKVGLILAGAALALPLIFLTKNFITRGYFNRTVTLMVWSGAAILLILSSIDIDRLGTISSFDRASDLNSIYTVINDHLNGRVYGRTTYYHSQIAIDSLSNFSSTFLALGVNYFYPLYLFKTFELQDLYSIFYAIIITSLVYFGAKALKRSSYAVKVRIYDHVIIFFLLNVIWILGTTNYVTAMRHTSVSLFLLFIPLQYYVNRQPKLTH